MKMLCPHCGVKGTADDSYIGKKVKCPKCEGTFEVETPEVQETLTSPEKVKGSEEIENSLVAESEESAEEKTLEWSDVAVELDEESADEEKTTDELEINEEELIGELAEEESMPVMEEFESDVSVTEEVTSLADVASTLHAQGFQGNDANFTEPVPDRPEFSLMRVIRRLFGREKN